MSDKRNQQSNPTPPQISDWLHEEIRQVHDRGEITVKHGGVLHDVVARIEALESAQGAAATVRLMERENLKARMENRGEPSDPPLRADAHHVSWLEKRARDMEKVADELLARAKQAEAERYSLQQQIDLRDDLYTGDLARAERAEKRIQELEAHLAASKQTCDRLHEAHDELLDARGKAEAKVQELEAELRNTRHIICITAGHAAPNDFALVNMDARQYETWRRGVAADKERLEAEITDLRFQLQCTEEIRDAWCAVYVQERDRMDFLDASCVILRRNGMEPDFILDPFGRPTSAGKNVREAIDAARKSDKPSATP